MVRIYRAAQISGSLFALAALTAVSSVTSVTALSTQQTTVDKAFCTSLTDKAAAAEDRFDSLKSRVTKAWNQQDATAKQLAESVDKKVTDARQKVDDQRQLNFAKLEDKASTDAEKTAVKTYEAAINEAAQVRRNAVDAARTTFRDAVVDATKARRTNLSNQAGGLKSAVEVAFSTAQTSCDGGVAPATVRLTLLSSLKTSRETFADQRKADTNIREQIGKLVKTRNIAIKTADRAFSTSTDVAAATLKAAFSDQTDI